MSGNFLKNRAIFLTLGGLALFLLIQPLRASFALTSNDISNALVNGGSVWLETTLIVALAHISVVAFSLQIARSYFLRIQNKFSQKLGSDLSWLIYVIARDAFLVLSLIVGLLVFLPATFLDYPMAVPFMPVAVVLFGAALVTKLYLDADENPNGYRLVTLFISSGTFLWTVGTIFVTESPLFLSTIPAGVSPTNGIWFDLVQTFNSQNNLSLAMATFESCLLCLGILAILGVAHSMWHWTPGPRDPIVRVKYTSTPLPSVTNVAKSDGTRRNTQMARNNVGISPRSMGFDDAPLRPDYIN